MLSDDRADQLFAADYPCPKCFAPASEPCMTPNQRIAGIFHKERRERAVHERQGPAIGDFVFADGRRHRVSVGGSAPEDLVVITRRSFERHVRRRYLSFDGFGFWHVDEAAARSEAKTK